MKNCSAGKLQDGPDLRHQPVVVGMLGGAPCAACRERRSKAFNFEEGTYKGLSSLFQVTNLLDLNYQPQGEFPGRQCAARDRWRW